MGIRAKVYPSNGRTLSGRSVPEHRHQHSESRGGFMTLTRVLGLALALFLCVPAVFATTYITVPSDRELIDQSRAIVIGTVEGSYVQKSEAGGFETIYEIRVKRSLKGSANQEELLRVASPGGEKGRFGSYTPGAAHFESGEKALLFLARDKDRWTVTEMALGTWRFATSMKGEGLLVRDLSEVETFEQPGSPEPLRSEERFLRFIQDVVVGAPTADDYLIPASEAPREPSKRIRSAVDSLADPKRYTQMGASAFGVRWPTASIGAGLSFHKTSGFDLSGAGDGGVSVIQNGLASWTNDALSNVTLNYGGTTAFVAGNTVNAGCAYNGFSDCFNVVQYNVAIGGAAGIATITFFTNDTDGNAGTGYREIIDADVRISNVVNSVNIGLPSIMTHELGHSIGFRHSNGAPDDPNAQTPSCGGVDDCENNTNGAIMYYLVTNAGNGFVLQPWDIRAVGAVYPGAGAPAAPTGVVATATGATQVTITWNTAVGATSYRVYRRAPGGVFGPDPIATVGVVTNYVDNTAVANTAYLYKVRSSNGAESGDSNIDLATTVIFTDPTLTAGSTAVKAVHFTELRTAVNAVRTLAGLG